MPMTSQPPAGGAPSSPSGFDAAAVAAAARRRDPGLPAETAALLAGQAGELLGGEELDAPALARGLLAANSDVGASAANVVAAAAISLHGTAAP